MSRYLVTGGAGFIGSHIVEALVKKREEVVVFDNFCMGKIENIAPFLKKIKLVKGDLRNFKQLKKAVKGIDYVLHQAALRSVPKSIGHPVTYTKVNVNGTLNLLMASREAKVKRLIYASSSSVYGQTKTFPETENILPQPISPYAVTKLCAEYYCYLFSQIYGLETVSLRYFNVFGPRQSLESQYAIVIPKFITCLLKDKPPPINGDGYQSRDFTYIDNVVEANLLAARIPNISGEIFNIACGRAYTVRDLAKTLNKLLKKDIQPLFLSPRPGDVKHTLADITKAKRLLKFKVKVNFKEGLERTIKWFAQKEKLS
jgi:nucleoside-diphosphate-sugar epimerase